MEAKIVHSTLAEKAYEKLRAGLISAQFGPGEVLKIRPLAEQYGISATPVREALQRLVAENALELQPNKSIRVPVLTASRFSEIMRMRMALEPIAAELAFGHLGRRTAPILDGLVEDMDATIDEKNIRKYTALNEQFHFEIYDKSNANLLLGVIRDLWVLAAPYFSLLFNASNYASISNDWHVKIIAALREGDSRAFSTGIRKDIDASYHDLIAKLR